MDKRMAIFPLDYHNVSLARHARLGGYEAVALAAPSLSVLDGADIAKLDGGAMTGIALHADYKQQISGSDMAYFLDSELVTDELIYQNLISYADGLGKEVVISPKLSKRLGKEEREVVKEPFLKQGHGLPMKLFPIDVPIISIFAMGKNCGQLESELSVREHFVEKGYRVLQFGSEECASLLGCRKFPSFLFDASIDVEGRIFLFNKFLYDLCREERPELLIMGVPNPIMKYNDEILNGFGMIPFIVQSGIKSDIGILNMHYGQYTYEYLVYMMSYCKFRLGIETKYFGISNTSFSKKMNAPGQLGYLSLSTDFVNANLDVSIGREYYTVYPIYDEEKRQKAYEEMENELI